MRIERKKMNSRRAEINEFYNGELTGFWISEGKYIARRGW